MSNAAQVVSTLLEQDFDDPKAFAMGLIGQQNDALAQEKSTGVVNPKTVAQYQIIYHKTERNADGTAARAKVTSIKTWKTRPNEFQIGWKHGMYAYGTIGPHNADQWTTIEPPAITPQKRRR